MDETYTPVVLSDEDFAKQMANVEATRAAKVAEAQADRDVYMQPLRNLVALPLFVEVQTELARLALIYRGDDYTGQSVKNAAFSWSWMADVSRMDLEAPQLPDASS